MAVRRSFILTGVALVAAGALTACGGATSSSPDASSPATNQAATTQAVTTQAATTQAATTQAATTQAATTQAVTTQAVSTGSIANPAGSTADASAVNVTESNPPGDIPDNQVFIAYSPTQGGYSLQVPEGWARTDNGTTTLFTDKYNSIRIETTPSPTAPTVGSGQAEVDAIGSAAQGFSPGEVTVVQRPAGDAVLITYRADSPRNEVTGKVVSDAVERYEFWKDGTTAVLTLSGPVGADNVDPWRTVSESFGWTA